MSLSSIATFQPTFCWWSLIKDMKEKLTTGFIYRLLTTHWDFLDLMQQNTCKASLNLAENNWVQQWKLGEEWRYREKISFGAHTFSILKVWQVNFWKVFSNRATVYSHTWFLLGSALGGCYTRWKDFPRGSLSEEPPLVPQSPLEMMVDWKIFMEDTKDAF